MSQTRDPAKPDKLGNRARPGLVISRPNHDRIAKGRFEIALAATTEPDLWMLQIACTNEPGLIARLFGQRSIDRSGDVYQIAVAVHEALREHGYTDVRWRLDGYPDDGESTPEPVLARETAT